MFKEHDESMKTAGSIIRPCAIFLSMLGWYLLFSPVMALLAFIPLVGSLLSMTVSLAVAIFAFIVGGTVACLVLGLAWLFFRPIIGASLLSLTGVGVFLICFYK